MAYNSNSIPVNKSTYFTLINGLNSGSFEIKKDTYFTLLQGLNSSSFGLDLSVVCLEFEGQLYTQAVDITVTSSQGSYTLSNITGGVFTLYQYTIGGVPIEHTIIAYGAGVEGDLTLTPATPSQKYILTLEGLQCINREFANKVNPFQFRSAAFTIGTGCKPFCDDASGLGCDNQYIREKKLNMPILVQGDELRFMLNLDLQALTGNEKIAILDSGFNFVDADININQVDNGNDTYTWYSDTFAVPCLDIGCYYITIYDSANDTAIYISRPFKSANRTNWREQTRLLKYRNATDIGGFKFEALPSFYQQIRLDINQTGYRVQSDKTSYREQSTKSTRNIQSTTDKYVSFKTFQFDEDMHFAFALAMDCNEIFLDDIQYRSFETYEPNAEEIEDLSNGTIELYEVGFSYSSKSC